MLRDKSSSAIVAVSDMERAEDFYANVLGLELTDKDMDGVLTFRTGDTALIVYRSEGLRPGTGNAVAWSGGGDVESIADDLRAKGVKLEEYPELAMDVERGVHRDGDLRAIWFKDPDGNILHVNSM
jgi:catechol 2,3-dioxygenase-like lactoylglutathione lyase family enzyme